MFAKNPFFIRSRFLLFDVIGSRCHHPFPFSYFNNFAFVIEPLLPVPEGATYTYGNFDQIIKPYRSKDMSNGENINKMF